MPAQLPASLSRRLLWVQGIVLALTFLVTGLVIDQLFRSVVTAGVHDRLSQGAIGAATLVNFDAQGRPEQSGLDALADANCPSAGRYLFLHDTEGRALWQSAAREDVPFTLGPLPAHGQLRFDDDLLGNGGGHFASLSTELARSVPGGGSRTVVLTIAEDRNGGVQRRAHYRRTLVAWFMIATAVPMLLMWLVLRHVLAPLWRLAVEIAEVEAGRRVAVGDDYPREVSGLARTLNALLRADQLRMARYRDTLGNLAHGLKTPLASMRAALAGQAPQVRTAVDLEIDRIAQLAEHQLRRAGTAGPVTLGQKPIPVLPIVVELRTAMLRVHGSKDLSIEVSAEPAAGFLGDRSDLLELLGNVLDNASKWCAGRVQVAVALHERFDDMPWLQVNVSDDGPGIDPADRTRVLARGVRADERAPGHGLGLAMVSDTVALYGGNLRINQSSVLGGACITISLPGRLIDGSA
jgi:two-component system, OmpR family, sensor histidine kinase PhoQ